jgi:flavin reductase (DIM6/NTAB) family NADH-FMN oxidoreductase RutF
VGAYAVFDELVGNLEFPMFIVTARAPDGEPLGCLVGFTTQTSIHPKRFVVCLSQANRTYRVGRDAEHLGVHCVPADAGDLAELFGGQTADEVDKFARVAWHEGPGGVPILDRCRNWFVGRVVTRVPAGDHDAYVLEPIEARAGEQEDFMFHMAKRIAPGHEA